MAKNFVIGAKSKLLFTLVPDSLVDSISASSTFTSSTITTSASTTSGAVSISVTALANPVPAHTPLTFSSGGTNVKVYTTASAAVGATAISVAPTSATIASGATSTYVPLLEVEGVTTATMTLNNADVQSYTYGSGLGFASGVVTTANWEISMTANVLSSSESYYRVSKAAQTSVSGSIGFVQLQDPPPAGFSNGDSYSGLCSVGNYSKTSPADGIITYSVTFRGSGDPLFKPYY